MSFALLAILSAKVEDNPHCRRRIFAERFDKTVVCTENLIRVDDVKKSPKLAE
jgi:hypothetical protein